MRRMTLRLCEHNGLELFVFHGRQTRFAPQFVGERDVDVHRCEAAEVAQHKRWESAGQVSSAIACPETVEALRSGAVTTAPSNWDDIVAGDSRFPVQPALKPHDCN